MKKQDGRSSKTLSRASCDNPGHRDESRRGFLSIAVAAASGALVFNLPDWALAQAMEKPPSRKEMQATMAKIRQRLKTDTAFAAALKKDPVAALGDAGIKRDLAVNIIANDLAVKAGKDWCICTGCCCTGCCVTGKKAFDERVLPAAKDQAKWKALAKGQ